MGVATQQRRYKGITQGNQQIYRKKAQEKKGCDAVRIQERVQRLFYLENVTQTHGNFRLLEQSVNVAEYVIPYSRI